LQKSKIFSYKNYFLKLLRTDHLGNRLLEFIRNLAVSSETESVQVAFRSGYINGLLELLNSTNPIYDVSPKGGQNYLVDIIIGDYLCEGVIWLKEEDKLLFNGVRALSQIDQRIVERKRKEGKKLPFQFSYTIEYTNNKADLTPYFKNGLSKTKTNFTS
jgi:hypothetical protein